MTLEEFAYLAEIIGVILVIASLIYVAQQLRQNTNMMRAESRNEIFHGHQQDLFAMVEHPEIWRGIANTELDDENIRLFCWLTAHFRGREHEWFQFRNEALDLPAWQSYSSAASLVLSSRRIRAWWDIMKSAYDREFVERIDELAGTENIGDVLGQAGRALSGGTADSKL